MYDIIWYGKAFSGGKCHVLVEVIMMKFTVVMMQWSREVFGSKVGFSSWDWLR